MNFGKMGLVLFVLGLVIAGIAGINRMSLDRLAVDTSVEATIADGTLERIGLRADAEALRHDRDNMMPWIIGGAVTAILGLGMIFAAAGSSGPSRTCPTCAETIRETAKICRYCGVDLPSVRDPDPDYLSEGESSDRTYSYRALAKAAEQAERAQRRD